MITIEAWTLPTHLIFEQQMNIEAFIVNISSTARQSIARRVFKHNNRICFTFLRYTLASAEVTHF